MGLSLPLSFDTSCLRLLGLLLPLSSLKALKVQSLPLAYLAYSVQAPIKLSVLSSDERTPRKRGMDQIEVQSQVRKKASMKRLLDRRP